MLSQVTPVSRSKTKTTDTVLLRPKPTIIEHHTCHLIPANLWHRSLRYILHEKPRWPRCCNYTFVLRNQVRRKVMSLGMIQKRQPRPSFARRPANHPIEFPRRRVEGLDVAAPQQVRSAHDTKALLLEGSIQETDAGKEAEDEHHNSIIRYAPLSLRGKK